MFKKETIAVDLGGTNLSTALVKGNKILKFNKVRTPETSRELIKVMISEIEKLMSWKIKGIGVASPGPLKNGVIINPPNLPLRNFNLKRVLERKFRKKVVVENDANCVALAELKYGAGRRYKNFIILTLGTGIGGGVVINGELYKGKGNGGELGHIIIQDGKDMEYYAGFYGQIRRTKKTFSKELKIIDLLKMKNNSHAKKSVDETADYLGMGIASLIHAFDPEIVVLAGGVRETGNEFLFKIKKKVRKYLIFREQTPIVWTKLNEAGVLGAGTLLEK